jgi:IclR family acetate operon transcriptional repressor
VSTESSTERRGGTRIQSVARGCRLLLWLAEREQGATAKEVAFANRLALATTYHILNTLLDEGLLAKEAKRRYVLGPGAAALAQAYLGGAAVPEGLLRALRALAVRTSAAAYLGDWGDREIRMLATVEGERLLRGADVTRVAVRDAHARANGKVLLAFAGPTLRHDYLSSHPPRRLTHATTCEPALLERELVRVREQGFAYDDQQYVEGLSCVAAPVLRHDRVVASFAISVPSERFARGREELTRAVLDVARAAAGGAFDRPAAGPGPHVAPV